MYDLPYHKARDAADVKTFVRDHPFAVLIGCDEVGRPVATQVPVFMDEVNGQVRVRGHIMRGTKHHNAFLKNDQALILFTGPHCYVSGSWYANPKTPSTWNYMSVHARGRLRLLDDSYLPAVLRDLSIHFEEGNQRSPTTYDNLPAELVDRLAKQIVAFEVVVSDLDSVFKLSQDRDQASYGQIIEELKGGGEAASTIAAEMERRIPDVFPKSG